MPTVDPNSAADDGSADPELRQLLSGGRTREAVAALRGARLLIPILAVPGEDGATMAAVSMVNEAGGRGLLAFTGLDSMARWDASARPVPLPASRAARAAIEDGAEALVVDVLGPVRLVLAGEDLASLAADG